jgi:integrase
MEAVIENKRERLVERALARMELQRRQTDECCALDPLYWLQNHTKTENEEHLEQRVRFRQPFRTKLNQWDPNCPMTNSGIKKPWLELRRASGIEWLTPHCLRHQANTKLYEAGADDMTIMSIMGHQTRQMSEHYSQIREQRKREALEAAFGYDRSRRHTLSGKRGLPQTALEQGHVSDGKALVQS